MESAVISVESDSQNRVRRSADFHAAGEERKKERKREKGRERGRSERGGVVNFIRKHVRIVRTPRGPDDFVLRDYREKGHDANDPRIL